MQHWFRWWLGAKQATSCYLNQCWPSSLTYTCGTVGRWVNTLRQRQNGRHFADDIFKCIFLNENVWIPMKISTKFVPKGPSNNIPTLVQIMAWRRPGDKPLSEPMMVSLTTHICVTRPQWVNRRGISQSVLMNLTGNIYSASCTFKMTVISSRGQLMLKWEFDQKTCLLRQGSPSDWCWLVLDPAWKMFNWCWANSLCRLGKFKKLMKFKVVLLDLTMLQSKMTLCYKWYKTDECKHWPQTLYGNSKTYLQ